MANYNKDSVSRITNSMKANLWMAAQHSEECRKAVYFIEKLSKRMGLSKAGLMSALILSGIRFDPEVKAYAKGLEKEYKEAMKGEEPLPAMRRVRTRF